MHFYTAGSGNRSQHFVRWRYGGFSGIEQTAAVAAGLAVPGRVDDSVCADGDCILSGGDLKGE